MPEAMSKDEIAAIIKEAVDNAVDYNESELALGRLKAQRYFDGEVDIGHEEGRSKVVSTKVRDTVRAIKPSLMRIFLANEKPVEYIPMGQEDIKAARQATQYAHYKFNELNGFRIIRDAFHDALVKKTGIVKVFWETKQKNETHTFEGLNDAEFALIANDDDVTILEHTVSVSMDIDETGLDIERPIHDLKISRTTESGDLCFEGVPPEEFFVDSQARSTEDFYVIGHRTDMRVGDLVAMGYDFEEVSQLSDLEINEEDYERKGNTEEDDENVKDPSMRLVAVSEAYMRMDVDGTGVPQMHKFLLGGNDYKLLDYENWDEHPFAVFEIDPEPHTFYGRSIPDLIMNDQDASTAMLRGVLDNVAITNMPRTEAVEGQVNMDDLLNNEIGAVVRVKQLNATREIAVPFIAGTTLPAMQYLDDAIEAKTGVSRASMGLDPDALQNTTATAAQLTAQQGAGQIEVMARNLAEGGMKRMFKLILKLMKENVEEEVMMRLNGEEYLPVDPRTWNDEMDLSVNVGLGTGREQDRIAALQMTLQTQMSIWGQYGPQNGIVKLTQIRNTLADILALGGIRNSDRYYETMTPEKEQALIQAAMQQAAQQQQAPNQLAEAEQVKAMAKMQSDQMKAQLDAMKAIADDDRQRDKMDQELLIQAAEIIGKYGTSVDVERIKSMQNQPRYPDQVPTQAAVGGRY